MQSSFSAYLKGEVAQRGGGGGVGGGGGGLVQAMTNLLFVFNIYVYTA